MATWRKAFASFAALLLAVICIGYATAWFRLSSCTEQGFAEITRHGTTGMGLDGDAIAMTRQDVHASIAGPFLVDVQYLVPHDLHGTLHVSQYLALPWGAYQRTTNAYHLM